MTLRKFIFWLHLPAGVIAGAVILLMSVTGVLLTYEQQMIRWVDTRSLAAVEQVGIPLGAGSVLEKMQRAGRDLPTTLTAQAGPGRPVVASYGREGVAYVHPYSGEILGEGSRGVRTFFQRITAWHRWFGAEGENRAAARAVTGACNLAFLFLVCSGLYLWFPRKWNASSFRAIAWFRGGLGGKARDFNWHNVFGFWTCVPLFFVVITAVVMSYPWANDLLFRMAGEQPPVRGAAKGGGKAGQKGVRKADGKAGKKGGRGNGLERARPDVPELQPVVDLDGLNELWARAATHSPGWHGLSMRVPTNDSDPVSFTIYHGAERQPQKRAELTLDRATGAVVAHEPFESQTPGRQLRSWARFVHTGEAFGWWGQTIAGIASFAGVMLVWTGIALAFRRFLNWRNRPRNGRAAPASREQPVSANYTLTRS
jgi:uncharacterized iron-regulated membrane protein